MKTQLFVLALAVGLTGAAWSQDPAPAEKSTDLDVVVQGNTQFALDLYARLREPGGNVVYSPYSISTCLAMVYGGARDQTATQFAKTMRYPLPTARFHPAMRLLDEKLRTGESRDYELHIANAAWGQKGYPFLPQYLDLVEKNYRGGLHQVDFVKDSAGARKAINEWTEQQTNHKIVDLVPNGALNVDTRLVVTNAIYLKAYWYNRFDKSQTKNEPFEVSVGKTVSVPMMYQAGQRFRYRHDESFQWLELPYEGDRLAMIVLLPRKKGALSDVEKRLTAETLRAGIDDLAECSVEKVWLPRFKIDCGFGLLDELTKMGLPTRPFLGVANDPQLFLADVRHKAMIVVDEEGTEAAAATSARSELQSLPAPAPPFRADHPFLFLIRDSQTGSVLFLGRVSDPSKT